MPKKGRPIPSSISETIYNPTSLTSQYKLYITAYWVSIWTTPEVIRRIHVVHPTGFDAYSSIYMYTYIEENITEFTHRMSIPQCWISVIIYFPLSVQYSRYLHVVHTKWTLSNGSKSHMEGYHCVFIAIVFFSSPSFPSVRRNAARDKAKLLVGVSIQSFTVD